MKEAFFHIFFYIKFLFMNTKGCILCISIISPLPQFLDSFFKALFPVSYVIFLSFLSPLFIIFPSIFICYFFPTAAIPIPVYLFASLLLVMEVDRLGSIFLCTAADSPYSNILLIFSIYMH